MSSNNILPQTSGDLSIVHYTDAQGNENFFIRAWVKGSKVLIPLKEVMDDVNSSIENIKKLIPDGTSEENPLVNNLKLYKELHRVPNGGTLLAGAKVGDILWVDPNNGDKYFFDKAIYPVSQAVADGLESVGVVADVDGRKLLILHKDESESVSFANCWLFKVTNINLDGTTNTLNMQRFASNGNAVSAGTFTDNTSTTLTDFCTALDTWLREHQDVPGAVNADWHCELMPDANGVDSCFIVLDVNLFVNRLTPIASGSTATATMYMWSFAKTNTIISTLLRNNGSSVDYAGWNKEALITYFSDPTHASISPTDDPNGTGLLNKADFEGSSYPNVKAAYNNDYDIYIEDMLMKWPSETGGQASLAGTGAYIGNNLGTHTHKNLAGEIVYTFTACRYAYTRATTGMKKSENLGDGAWHLPDVVETFLVLSKMKMDGTDAINESLSAIGDSFVTIAENHWTSSFFPTANSWSILRRGTFGSSSLSSTYKCLSVALLEY